IPRPHVSYVAVSFLCSDTPTTAIYTLSLHDALPILGIFRAEPAGKVFCEIEGWALDEPPLSAEAKCGLATAAANNPPEAVKNSRSEEHTSELQSRGHLVCRLLLEKKNDQQTSHIE